MGYLTNYGENKLLDHTLKVTPFTRPTHWYLALCTADPGEAATGDSISEPSGGSYARQICDDWAAAASRATSNSAKITYPTATVDWGALTHFAICDALTSGNVIAYGPITPNKTIATGDVAEIEIGDLDVSFNAGGLSDYLANALLDHTLPTGSAFSVPATIFIAAATASILDSDTGSTISEPTGGSYARKEFSTWNTASGGASSNDGEIAFVQASGAWGTIQAFALCDAETAGNILFKADVGAAKAIESGDTMKFADEALDITLD